MFDFLKKKADPIYTIKLGLEDYDWQVGHTLSEDTELKIKGNKAYYKKNLIGSIHEPLLEYFRSVVNDVDITATIATVDPFKVRLEVRGTWIDADPFEPAKGPKGKEYMYRNILTYMYPALLPEREYKCDLVKSEDGFDIIAGGIKAGTLQDDKDGKRVATLARMLAGNECSTSVMASPVERHMEIYVFVRF